MFWNDPILYGATFPYREFTNTMASPFFNQNVPNLPHVPQRFVAPTLGYDPYFSMAQKGYTFPIQQQFVPQVQPWNLNVPQMGFNPTIHPQFVPQVQPWNLNVPQMGFNPSIHPQFVPQVQPWNLNLAQQGWIRPFGC